MIMQSIDPLSRIMSDTSSIKCTQRESYNCYTDKRYTDYQKFNSDYKFEDKAGFKLTELQVKDINQFVLWDRSLNTYEVGGGKTVVSSVVALMRGADYKIVTALPVVITPWVKWLNKVSEHVLDYRGLPKQRKAYDVAGSQWIVMTHAIFRDDFDVWYPKLQGSVECIVDEAHSLKNPGSVLFRKVSKLVNT